MAITERTVDPPERWVSHQAVQDALTASTLLVLPDGFAEDGETTVAHFRPDANAVRVRANQAGVQTTLLVPAGVSPVVYSEYADRWVLPVLVAAVLSVPSSVAATLIADRIEAQGVAQPIPTVVYREVIATDNKMKIREIEGPGDEVLEILLSRSEPRGPSHPR